MELKSEILELMTQNAVHPNCSDDVVDAVPVAQAVEVAMVFVQREVHRVQLLSKKTILLSVAAQLQAGSLASPEWGWLNTEDVVSKAQDLINAVEAYNVGK